ncbi:MAG: hypothetical protein IKE90_03690 [Bacilli bacterium]|nr:hypothetical protein [Bacilli bacterium]
MMFKTYEIPELLVFKILDNEEILSDIKQFYPNLVESNKEPEYCIDRQIVENLDNYHYLINQKPLHPFRNCIYYNQTLDETHQIVAYAPANDQTIEHAIIRNGKEILIQYKKDNSKVFTRTVRELIFRKFLEKGYFPLHASATKFNGNIILNFGPKGCGKSTVLFEKIIEEGHQPVSNDITLVGKENNVWNAIGTQYTLSFDSSLFGNDGSSKIRFTPYEFSKVFHTVWSEKGQVNQISYLSLDKNMQYSESALTSEQLFEKLNLYGKDHGFYFDDYLEINNLVPIFDYEALSMDLTAVNEKGNIFNRSR